ncbi:MAG: hypothetical protein AAF557_19945 [Pseudomonadota bacterium]
MTDASIAQDEPVLVAIDIAKGRHEVLISAPGSLPFASSSSQRRLISDGIKPAYFLRQLK